MANQIVWVDIPVLDLDRAVRFYSAVLGAEVQKQESPRMTIAVLPGADSGDVSGCLFMKDDEKPSDRGMLVYLNAQGRPRSSGRVWEAMCNRVGLTVERWSRLRR